MNPEALWNNWDEEKHYGELLYRRATGEAEEMHSSQAISKVIKEFYKPRMKVLDVGCGAGHYLVSLRRIVDKDIDYTGVDPTAYYLDLGKKAFGDTAKFKQGGVFDIPFPDNSFDIVICNHVILHMPPENIQKAFNELIRVSKRLSITRTAFGERNYMVKEILTHNDLRPEQPVALKYDNFDLTQHRFRYFNMYTPEFIRQMILSRNDVMLELRDDRDFKPFDNTGKAKISTATKTVGDMQVSGNLILDYKFIITEKKLES
jgi:ubiquinone/menaquinone biosynthesis C-methylase UbiE